MISFNNLDLALQDKLFKSVLPCQNFEILNKKVDLLFNRRKKKHNISNSISEVMDMAL